MPDASNAAFVNHWSRLSPLLSSVVRREQRGLSAEQHLQAVANVLAVAAPDMPVRITTGLVEQQRLFMRAGS